MTAATDNNVVPVRRHKMSIDIIAVTPKMAAEWLAKNRVNRSIRDRRIAQYADDMTAGRWTMTGDTIRFSITGDLLDGQHRLNAIIRSGATVPFVVIRRLDPSAQADMDSGAKRTASDALGLLGHSRSMLLAAAAKLIILYSNDQLGGSRTSELVSHSAIIDFVEANPSVERAVQLTDTWRTSIDAPPSVIATAHWVLSLLDPHQATEFMEKLVSRTDLPPASPILALDTRLRAVRRSGVRPSQGDYLNLFFKAWNHWRAGRSVKVILLDQGVRPTRPR